MYIRWSELFETGIIEIDNQHKKLVEIINSLYEGYNSKENFDLNITINALIKYSEYHFATEEKLFKKSKYPYYEEHIKIHSKFKEKFADLSNSQKASDHDMFIETLTFLKDWLIDHILNTDREYLDYLN